MIAHAGLPGLAAAREYLEGFEHVRGFGLADFLDTSLERILRSLALLPPTGPESRVLELGAQPYLMTALLLRHTPATIHLANEGDRGGGAAGRFELKHRDWPEARKLAYEIFDVEKDVFPYEDGAYDAVFFCEIIEHLMHDPVHCLHEINRVLRPGGVLILSTPNAFRLENFMKVLRGRNFYPPYSGWGASSRHHREFTLGELQELLLANGFELESLRSHADTGYRYPSSLKRVAAVLDRWRLAPGLLDTIHLRARKSGPPRYSYPPEMFFDAHAYRRVSESALDMGDAPESQFGRGVFEKEVWPPAVRWTGAEAMFRLRRAGHNTAAIRFFSGPAGLHRPIAGELWVGGSSARFRVEPGTWETLRLDLEATASEGEIELVLRVDLPWRPSEILGSADTRELGVAVRRVWLE